MTMRVPKSAEDTDCEPRDGSGYTGTVNTTANGWTCRSWWRYGYKSHWASADDDFNHNYCRNPNGEDQVWCYTTNPQDPKEHCDVPACVVQTPSVEEIGCIPRDGTAYTGKANTTASGYVCNMWTDAYGHWHTGVGDHNYCRSLPGDKNVWCHSTRPLKTWEQCDVPFCVAPPQSVEEIGCVSRDEPIYTGQANVTASGLNCQIWSENTPHGHSFTGVGNTTTAEVLMEMKKSGVTQLILLSDWNTAMFQPVQQKCSLQWRLAAFKVMTPSTPARPTLQ